jgi:glucosamine-6-phosphate deaminase
VLKKRDSVLEKLDSPRSPADNPFSSHHACLLEQPEPADPEPPTSATLSAPSSAAATATSILRSVTPDLVPDAMHDRLQARPVVSMPEQTSSTSVTAA